MEKKSTKERLGSGVGTGGFLSEKFWGVAMVFRYIERISDDHRNVMVYKGANLVPQEPSITIMAGYIWETTGALQWAWACALQASSIQLSS